VKKSNLHYLAGALEHRGTISENPPCISLRTVGPLPKQLKRIFGGMCIPHRKKLWYRVKGRKAEILMRRIFPFLRKDKKRVGRILARMNK
jgi:hypothetical protein